MIRTDKEESFQSGELPANHAKSSMVLAFVNHSCAEMGFSVKHLPLGLPFSCKYP